ncbi:MAG: GDP-mannose 4,6-dehydratase [bacterium]
MKITKALVTGGAGFIGSHLVEKLLRTGYKVHVLDDLSTGSLDNVSHLRDNRDFDLTIGTVLNKDIVQSLVEKSDVVFHLAAAVGVNYVIENQIKSIQVNVGGTETVLEAASRWKRKVIVFSTSEVYGKSSAVPFKEDDDRILGPTTTVRWSYAVTKALDEIMALAYWREKGSPVVILRCFNTCGPRQTGRYGMVLPRFVNQALKGEPITVYGDGRQTRCFASVYDLVDGVVKIADCDKAVGEIFNIGSDVEVSILELAKRVKDIASSSSPIYSVPYEQAYGSGFEDMMRRVPDLAKIKSYIGYQPSVDLDGIIKDVIDHMRKTGHS